MATMYEVLIGFNVELAEGEVWKGKAGGKAGVIWKYPDGRREVRFEPGERTRELPTQTDIAWLEVIDAIRQLPSPPAREKMGQEVSDE